MSTIRYWSVGLCVGLALALAALAQIAPNLNGLTQIKNSVSKRASSSDPNWDTGGNGDARSIAPGETLVLANLNGPGVIHHIWFTIADKEADYPKLLALRMYWDDESHPSVEAPVGDFFAMGHGADIPVDSIPVSDTSNGRARNCYWPMPFAKHARIEVTNEGEQAVGAFYYQIDWEQVDALPPHTAYFHAMYRQEYPANLKTRYELADIVGHGQYVGTVYSVRARTPSWIGEGDDFFYIDGEKDPSLKGTGTEDYFCDAWGFREMNRPYYGAPLFEGFKTGDRTSVYRWHINDPVRFTKSLYVEIEHRGPFGLNPDGSFAPDYGIRLDDVSSVAYWYQTEPHKPWDPMPKGKARIYPQDLKDLYLKKDAYPPYVDLMLDMKMSQADAGTIRADSTQPNATHFTYSVQNPTDIPAEVDVSFPGHGDVKPDQKELTLQLPPGAHQEVPITFAKLGPMSAPAMQPVPIRATYRFKHASGRVISIPVERNVVFTSDFPVEKTSQPITVDGDLSEWGELPFVVTQPAQLRMAAKAWSGPDDCRYRFGVRCDEQNVYIGVDVKDDSVVLRPNQYPWQQDGVEIRLTALPKAQRDTFTGKNEFKDAVLFAMSPAAEGNTPVIHNAQLLPKGARYACKKTADGFAAEVAVPVTYLDQQQGASWKAFRLNVAVDDRDGDQQTQLWWRPDWRTPMTFDGSGTFVKH